MLNLDRWEGCDIDSIEMRDQIASASRSELSEASVLDHSLIVDATSVEAGSAASSHCNFIDINNICM